MAVLSRSGAGASERRREGEQAFLTATEALLDEGRSYAELSVEQIASRAGRPRTALPLLPRQARAADPPHRDRRRDAVRAGGHVVERDRGARDVRPALAAILGTWARHASLLGAVVEAATYDEEIGEFWRNLVGRFIDATERRLVEEGEEPEAAAAKAFVLCWMTNHACYQQHARAGSLDDLALLDALTDILERSVYGP